MKFYQYDGTYYVTARQLEKEYQLSRKKCWQVLAAARSDLRTTHVGNVPLYAWEDCLGFFVYPDPTIRAKD